MGNISGDIERVLVSGEEITSTVKRLASEIVSEYSAPGRNLMLLGILNGSVMVLSELMKYIDIPMTLAFMKVSSYGDGSVSNGTLKIKLDLEYDSLADFDVLVVEDIIDTGNTLSALLEHLKAKGARSVKLCTLLDKPSRRQKQVKVDFCGLQIPDEFVVGFGLDYAEKYRNMPFVGVLKREVYIKVASKNSSRSNI